MQRDTLVDVFRDIVAIRGDFLVHDDGYRQRTYTYDRVGRAARGFAARLTAAGVRPDERVVFWGENTPEWIACYWGCLIARVVVVPIDYRSSAAFVEQVYRLVEARVLLLGDQVRLPGAGETGADAGADAGAGSGANADAGLGAPAAPMTVWRFGDLDWRADGPMPDVAHDRDDVIQIIFTSGATGDPKGVVIRHRNVLANTVPVEREVTKYRRYARPFHPIRFLNLLPLSHMFGQSMATSIPPMLRGTVIFTQTFNPHDIVDLVAQRRVSVLVCVPKILEVLRDHVVRAYPESADAPPPGASIPSRWWRYRRVHRALGPKFWAFVVGAAPLPPDLEEFWRRMGFAVIQGYGLTETAPIVTLNHPFRTSKGSVGTPIGGVEIAIAGDGEILVRGDNVTSGYFVGAGAGTQTLERAIDADGWLHTGDIGERDAEGRVFIKGRKKELIVTPDGMNVFPEDVERVLNATGGVRDSAVVGAGEGAEHVHAVLLLEAGADTAAIVREANARLQDHQRIRSVSTWPGPDLPRTDGTRKLKRAQIREWVVSGRAPAAAGRDDTIESLVERFAHGRDLTGATTLEELGLSSLERVELMVAIEDRFGTRLDESRFSEAASIEGLRTLVESPGEPVEEPVAFPTWTRTWPVAIVRRLSLAIWILPIARLFAHLSVSGREHLRDLEGPVVFAANHQSHIDVPAILAALPGRWRARVAPAMAKEFFAAHFLPQGHTRRDRFKSRLLYYLAAFYFNAFPIPQREAGTRQTLRYMGALAGDGWSILIFPEGMRSETGHIRPFRGGIGMIGSRLGVPVVPVRIDGADRVLHQTWKMAHPGPVRVAFGPPLRLQGDDYAALARQVEDAVRAL
jgi:long-chain acyl-CoA synthetase